MEWETRQQSAVTNLESDIERLVAKHGFSRYPVVDGSGEPIDGFGTARADREAVNHPIQGSAADILKIAMIRLFDALQDQYQAKILLQVHDELVLETPAEELSSVEKLVVEIMSGAYPLDVPLKVEASSGSNWLELKD